MRISPQITHVRRVAECLSSAALIQVDVEQTLPSLSLVELAVGISRYTHSTSLTPPTRLDTWGISRLCTSQSIRLLNMYVWDGISRRWSVGVCVSPVWFKLSSDNVTCVIADCRVPPLQSVSSNILLNIKYMFVLAVIPAKPLFYFECLTTSPAGSQIQSDASFPSPF